MAHRLATVQNADVIFVFGEGGVLEIGNHQSLLKDRGVYYQMVSWILSFLQFDMANDLSAVSIASSGSMIELLVLLFFFFGLILPDLSSNSTPLGPLTGLMCTIITPTSYIYFHIPNNFLIKIKI